MWLIGIISNHINGEVHYFLHSDVSLLSWIPSCHPATIIQSAILVFSFMVWTVTEAPLFLGATAFPHQVFQPLRLTERRCNTPWGFLFCTNFTLYVKNVARSWQQKKSKVWVTVLAHLEMSPLRWELLIQVYAAQSGEGGDSFQVQMYRQFTTAGHCLVHSLSGISHIRSEKLGMGGTISLLLVCPGHTKVMPSLPLCKLCLIMSSVIPYCQI